MTQELWLFFVQLPKANYINKHSLIGEKSTSQPTDESEGQIGHCEELAGRVPINDTNSSILENSSVLDDDERLFL